MVTQAVKGLGTLIKLACLLIVSTTVLLTGSVSAAIVAADSAAESAYTTELGGAWKGDQPDATENPPGIDNGGFGFNPWNFAGGYHDPVSSPYGALNHFIDGVDFGSSAFNNLGSPAFALTNANIANFGFTARATRVFTQPLATGGSFSIEFDNPLLAPLHNNDTTGFIIRLNSGGGAKIPSNPNVRERLGLFALFGFNQGKWNVTNSTGALDTGINSITTASGGVFRVSLQSSESYLLEILPIGGGPALFSSVGNLASPGAGSIDTLEIVMFSNGSGNGKTGAAALPTGQREFFFDNLMLNNPQPLLVGDYNQNGTVDAADYTVWRDHFGEDFVLPNRQPSLSGPVVTADFDLWKMHFGEQLGSGLGGGTTIPEPASAILLVGAFAWCFARRRRRKAESIVTNGNSHRCKFSGTH